MKEYEEIQVENGNWFVPKDRSGNVYFQYTDKSKMTTPYTIELNVNGVERILNVWHSNSEACHKSTGIKVKYPCTVIITDDIYGRNILYKEEFDDYLKIEEAIEKIKQTSFRLSEQQSIMIKTFCGGCSRRIRKEEVDTQ